LLFWPLLQEIGWFDDPHNQVGSLCSRLSNDAAQIQGVSFGKFVRKLNIGMIC